MVSPLRHPSLPPLASVPQPSLPRRRRQGSVGLALLSISPLLQLRLWDWARDLLLLLLRLQPRLSLLVQGLLLLLLSLPLRLRL